MFAARRVNRLLDWGRFKEAGRVADDYLKRRAAWGTTITSADVQMEYARFRAGLISQTELEAFRTDWLGRAQHEADLTPWTIWESAYVLGVDDQEQAAVAIRAKPQGDPPDSWARVLLGTLYASRGDYETALPLLRDPKACSLRRWVEESVPLAKALAGTGDVAGACTIYGRIVEQLGQHEPAPLTVKRAKEQRGKIGCK